MTMNDEFKYARPEGQQRRRDAYGAIYDDALGSIVPPEMGAVGTQGPEGQLWQGLRRQQAFAASQAGRRGYDPSTARGASQANAELESQGYGAAQGIREQQAAYARQARLGLLRQRSAQDAVQSGIEGQQLGQTYSEYAFANQARDDAQAKKEAKEVATQNAIFGAIGAGAQVLGKVLSDKNQKKNMKDGDMAADKLMESMEMPQNRAAAKKYWNTPIGYARPRPSSGDELVAEFQRLGDDNDNDVSDDEVIAQLQRASDESDADATSPADIKRARLLALTARLNDRDRAVAGDGPNPADVTGKPVRFAGGSYVMPSYRPGEEAAQNVRHLVDPIAMPTMTRDEAQTRLGFKRAIDPRAADYVAREMPRANAWLTGGSDADIAGRPVRRADGVVEMPTQVLRPETPEDALRRREGERRAAILIDALNTNAQRNEARAARPAVQRESELASGISAYADEYSKKLGGGITDNAIDNTVPYSFDYKRGVGTSGRQLGTLAQDLQRDPLTNAMVVPTRSGLAIDPARAVGPLLGMVGRLGQRVKKVEGK